MRVLVTGGAGFIGRAIVAALRDDGDDAVVFDRAATPGPDSVRADVTDLDAMRSALGGIDAVCHQAAKVGLGVDFADAPDYVTVNDLGTATLLRAMHDAEFSGPFVLASSMVVYGEGRYHCPAHGDVAVPPRATSDLEAGRFDPPCPHCGGPLAAEAVTEDAPTDPRNVYAATKLAQEHLAAAFGREHPGVTVAALRYHNVYGPGLPRGTPYAGVAARFADAISRGEAPRVFEDGRQRRDFVHVADVARANVVALHAGEPGAFNVASGAPCELLAMAEALTAAAGPGAARPAVVGGYRLGDVRHVFASAERARVRLGFVASVPLAEGVRDVLSAPG